MEFFDFLLGKKKKLHKLKWKLPEQRLTIPLTDAEKTAAALEKLKAKFVSGGEFMDVVHAKDYGNGVFAYYLVRTEKKTEKESLVFDGYMLQEEETLGVNLSVASYVMDDLEQMGYRRLFERSVTEWRFSYATVKAAVFDVEGFGAFLEIALPQTNFESARKTQEKSAFELVEKLGFKKEDAIPSDVLTVQLMTMMEEAQKQGPQ